MKRQKVDRPVHLTISLPESVIARIRLHLWSEIEGRIPLGALSAFFIERAEDFFSQQKKEIP